MKQEIFKAISEIQENPAGQLVAIGSPTVPALKGAEASLSCVFFSKCCCFVVRGWKLPRQTSYLLAYMCVHM